MDPLQVTLLRMASRLNDALEMTILGEKHFCEARIMEIRSLTDVALQILDKMPDESTE